MLSRNSVRVIGASGSESAGSSSVVWISRAPRYTVDRVEGEAHAQTFHVSCDVPDIGRRSEGQGLSRRRAEQEAAERIILEIEGR
jgi:dsRNA-specific ribonuclease